MKADIEKALKGIDTASFAAGGELNRGQFDQFFTEVQDQTMLLDQVRFAPLDRPKQQIDKIGVGTRLLRESTEATDDGNDNDVNTGTVELDTTKVELPWELSQETVEDTIERKNTAQRILNLFTQQMGVDLEDLAINGDDANADDFLGIEDGWLTIAQNRVPADQQYDHGGAGIDKEVFDELIRAMPDKFKRTQNIPVLISSSQKQAFKDYLTDRASSAGDAMLMTGEEPTPYGYMLLSPPGWPDDKVMFTPPQNLIYGVQRDVRLRVTQEGESVVKKDLYAIYNLLARIDYEIEDENGVTIATNIAAP